MTSGLCRHCQRQTGFKRALGFGTFFAVVCTGGLWLLVIPFYPLRCSICGNESFGQPSGTAVGPTKDNWTVSIAGMVILLLLIIAISKCG